MTQKSAAELEREAEATRNRMSETAETLQRKLTPGQLVDEIGNYFKNSDGALAFDNLKNQVRDNPLPLALVGVGLAWLFMGGGPRADRISETYRRGFSRSDMSREDMAGGADSIWDEAPGIGGDWDADSETSDGPSMTERAASAYRSAGSSASSAAHTTMESAQWAGRKASRAGSRARSMLSDTLEQEPLIIGALGVAVGAAIGTLLPRSRFEEEYVAPYGESVRESVTDTVKDVLERTEDAASEALKAGRDEQGGRDESEGQSDSRSPSGTFASSSLGGSSSDRPLGENRTAADGDRDAGHTLATGIESSKSRDEP